MRIRSGPFTIDLDGRQLLRDRTAVHLTPKAFFLLTLLLDAAPRALSKDEIQQRLWPSTFVDEANLSVLVAEVRGALADNARHPVFIRTVHGFGYAFCGPVVREGAAPYAAQTTWWLVSDHGQHPLPPGDIRVGRDPVSDVVLDAGSVSRQHACLHIDEAGVTVEDLGSKNGTTVNGRPLEGTAPLVDGDEVRFGSVAVRVRRATPGGSTETIGPLPPG